MPLISFGDAPLVALIGEDAQRVPMRSQPSTGATFLPESADPQPRERTRRIAIIAILVVIAIAAIVLVAVLR